MEHGIKVDGIGLSCEWTDPLAFSLSFSFIGRNLADAHLVNEDVSWVWFEVCHRAFARKQSKGSAATTYRQSFLTK